MIHNIASHNWFSFELQDSIFEISTVETFATEVMANRPQTLTKKEMMTMHSRALNSEIYCKSFQQPAKLGISALFKTQSHKHSAQAVLHFTGYFGN